LAADLLLNRAQRLSPWMNSGQAFGTIGTSYYLLFLNICTSSVGKF
jgi:hypothetical protein